jgi:LacI family transcriptional regulator
MTHWVLAVKPVRTQWLVSVAASVRQDSTVCPSAAARRLVKSDDPPTAIHSAQNLITVGVIRALRDLGLSRKVAVVGFDDVAMGDLLDPPVTVISHDLARVGRVAAERLFARIDGNQSEPRTVFVPTELVVRGSGEIRPQLVS